MRRNFLDRDYCPNPRVVTLMAVTASMLGGCPLPDPCWAHDGIRDKARHANCRKKKPKTAKKKRGKRGH